MEPIALYKWEHCYCRRQEKYRKWVRKTIANRSVVIHSRKYHDNKPIKIKFYRKTKDGNITTFFEEIA